MTWLDHLLPPALLSPKTRLWWLAFFLLFPVAYAGGVLLEISQEREARIAGAEDRAASIRIAEQFAASKGFAVTNWHQYSIEETRANLLNYYETTKNSEIPAISAIAPAREVQVLFRSADQSREFRVYLSLTGHVTGYDYGDSSYRNRDTSSDLGIVRIQTNTTTENAHAENGDANTRNSAEREAEAIARRGWAANATLSKLVQLGQPGITTSESDSSRREVTWDVSPRSLKGLTLHLSTSVRAGQVVAQHLEAGVDKEHVLKKSIVRGSLEGLYSLFLLFGAILAMYRYAKRSLQKEVSHARTLVVALLFSISYGLLAYSLGVDQLATRINGAALLKIGIFSYVASSIVFAILGLLVGVGYGSGEGELREAYPGKLTSLDALLAGRILSQNVAASFLFGAAMAGWLLLAQYGLSYFFHHDVDATRTDALSYTFSRFPWLTVIFGRQYNPLLIAVTGLLLPASILLRRKVRWQRRILRLLIFAVLAVLSEALRYASLPLALVAIFVLVSALLLPFFAFDLLAAMVTLSALSFVDETVRLAEVVPSWADSALMLATLGAIMLAAIAYLALRGRKISEEEVRPLYAKNLAERMAMQAEVAAAREAQLRLLPQAAPEIPGVQLAACCLPARGVGGDFYDFFRLDTHRVGIFVAQGGAQGLASALCIALAKGLLMHASHQSHSPTQILLGLEESITELLESGSDTGISFAYGVMDTRRNLLTYAHMGSSPRFMIHREGAMLTASPQLERQVAEVRRRGKALLVFEGVTQASPGDLLIFATEGLLSLATRRFGSRNKQWTNNLRRELGCPDEPLQKALYSVLTKVQSSASEDLTAVVLRIREGQPLMQEVVA